jgi:ABC-type nitrate/sulfonate/bicarbonate transport system substrate-binding protein
MVEDRHGSSLSRRHLVQLAGGALGASLVAQSPSSLLTVKAAQEPTIPKATVRLATVAFTNEAWPIIGIRSGFFQDVGIDIQPPDSKVILLQQTVPQLQNNEIDITTMYLGLLIPTLHTITNIKPFQIYSYWQGNAILTPADSEYKTVDDFVEEGMEFEEAARATLEQLRGKQVSVPPQITTRPWMELVYGYADMALEDSELLIIEDQKAVQLGLSGRLDFAAPAGAVQIYQLQFQADWRPVISTAQILKYTPGGTGTNINSVLGYDVFAATQEYLDENHDTVLRFCSAVYRTLDYMFGPDQEEALALEVPFINANAGSDLDVPAIKYIFEEVDPFFTWDQQGEIFENTDNPLHFKNIYTYQVNQFVESGALPDQEYNLDDFFQAQSIWQEMRDLQTQADELMEQASGEELSDDRAALVTTAEDWYAKFNFLDAVRYLEAALA